MVLELVILDVSQFKVELWFNSLFSSHHVCVCVCVCVCINVAIANIK